MTSDQNPMDAWAGVATGEAQAIVRAFQRSGWKVNTVEVRGQRLTAGEDSPPAGGRLVERAPSADQPSADQPSADQPAGDQAS